MRYRTAAILSAVLVAVPAGMFGLSAVVRAALLRSINQGLSNPIPGYERILLGVALFCSIWKWMLALLALPIVVVLFAVAAVTPESQVRKMATPTPPPTSRPPTLWNPTAVACWSLLFSQAFGAFLHARNADAMGRVDEAKANRAWFYVSIAYLGFTLVAIFIPAIPEGIFGLAPIGLLLGWFFSLGRKQITYVKETWGDRYERKSWKKPLLIASCCLIGVIGTSIALTMVELLVLGSR
jgi:hypothetical protein